MPKSRGRPAGRGKLKRPQPVRQLRLSDRLLRDAVLITHEERVLEVDRWASAWLGRAWLAAGIGEREPEHVLHLEVVGRASGHPSPYGLAALAALRRMAAPAEVRLLDETIKMLAESQPVPSWFDAPAVEPVQAWRAVDVYDSEHVLFVEYGGADPHTLMARILLVGGVLVDTLELLTPGAAIAWETRQKPGDVPMPVHELPVDDALAELADAMRTTDMTLPRQDDEEFVDLRAIAWSRCRSRLPDRHGFQPLEDAERGLLLDDFAAGPSGPDDDLVARSLADLFLDYGDGYITSGPLCWGPVSVELFMTDWLPRKAVLDTAQRAALPEVLRRWIRFALARRGVDTEWIEPVVQAVDTFLPEFTEAFDDTAAWGPAKQIAAELARRGVDMSDHEAVGDAVRALNAARLARHLIGE